MRIYADYELDMWFLLLCLLAVPICINLGTLILEVRQVRKDADAIYLQLEEVLSELRAVPVVRSDSSEQGSAHASGTEEVG